LELNDLFVFFPRQHPDLRTTATAARGTKPLSRKHAKGQKNDEPPAWLTEPGSSAILRRRCPPSCTECPRKILAHKDNRCARISRAAYSFTIAFDRVFFQKKMNRKKGSPPAHTEGSRCDLLSAKICQRGPCCHWELCAQVADQAAALIVAIHAAAALTKIHVDHTGDGDRDPCTKNSFSVGRTVARVLRQFLTKNECYRTEIQKEKKGMYLNSRAL
jgi:hypothetical protein